MEMLIPLNGICQVICEKFGGDIGSGAFVIIGLNQYYLPKRASSLSTADASE
jgi:hypothetical protein